MGKLIFNSFQKLIFEEFAKNSYLRDNFYFGGGTALSVFYFQHRYSDDLDFFTKKEFDQNLIVRFINILSGKLNLISKMTKKQTVLWFDLQKGEDVLKIDFIDFPYKRVEKGLIYKGVEIDNDKDIGANKILTLNLENNPKDYVDLYFLLQKYTVWDLMYMVEAKFRLKLDLISLGEDFYKVGELEFLPKMIKPLTLDELKKFFREKAKELGKRSVE